MKVARDTCNVLRQVDIIHAGPLPFGITWKDIAMINRAYYDWLARRFPDEVRGLKSLAYGKKEN